MENDLNMLIFPLLIIATVGAFGLFRVFASAFLPEQQKSNERKHFAYCIVPEDPNCYCGQGDLKRVSVTKEECESCHDRDECRQYKEALEEANNLP